MNTVCLALRFNEDCWSDKSLQYIFKTGWRCWESSDKFKSNYIYQLVISLLVIMCTTFGCKENIFCSKVTAASFKSVPLTSFHHASNWDQWRISLVQISFEWSFRSLLSRWTKSSKLFNTTEIYEIKQ